MSQAHDLHRALLRPAIIHILRAAGFHSTRPSVLDTLVNIAERYMLLLASTTAQHAYNAHNDPLPTVTDVRMALADCGALTPADTATEEEWRELMRIPVSELQASVSKGGEKRAMAEKRKRDEQDVRDIKRFWRWFEGDTHTEMRRIAGLVPDASSVTGATAGGGGGGGGANLPAVGVGGGVVQAEDYLTVLKKRMHGKAGQDDSRLQGTVLGRHGAEMGEDGGGGEFGEVVIEGGPVQRIRDWMPKLEDRVVKASSTQDRRDSAAAGKGKEKGAGSNHVDGDLSMAEAEHEAETAAS
ncbi:hypothetical protein KC332_g16101 [Hortaea werneckii]|uniref:Bromodomain associated domain-containing protein n=2 Tax=Hortaea werneckii TaxID=91943 RepID=A0A3M7IXB5_HORWE|nr:hypothetical protein KC358_g16230 [Hortaea werneckii]OTA37919.1 hypothetical protein BTJ68_02430 [Hortaea werneckii EXF-2000]KAI6799963.1 hypothetical protein KC350_g15960 [Hortaea werneckii]KAI6902016.1 hypothetical protein KC348_g16243 [Hortaea werneckii]KAI6921242.1 hypothetical protein KC341_g16055 [Hortaea werneckii]